MIHYLDANYQQKTELVTMNGTTPVLTVATDILRVNRFHSARNGSFVVAAGKISLTADGGATTYSLVPAGLNSSRQAVYTVPAGVTGYVSHWQASSGSTGNHFCTLTLAATQHDGAYVSGTFLAVDEAGTQNGGMSMNLPVPIRIPAKADVQIVAQSDASNANVTAIGAIMGWFETD